MIKEIQTQQEDDDSVYCASINTVAIHSLNNPKHTEHIKPLWLSRDPSSQVFRIDCEVDTGAGCNILPLYKAKALFGDELSLNSPTVTLSGYNDAPVQNLGSCHVYLYHGSNSYKILCQVADSRGPMLLGRHDALKLGYVNFPSINPPEVKAKAETTIKAVAVEPVIPQVQKITSHSITVNGKTHQLPTTKEYLLKEYASRCSRALAPYQGETTTFS